MEDLDKIQKPEDAYDAVHPGWWPLLDTYIPQLFAIDPNCEILVKEKFGRLRLDTFSEALPWTAFTAIERAAELDSVTICENCGQPGTLRTDRSWIQTLCDRCAALDAAGLREVIQETERKHRTQHPG